jgi:hypothetical protein
VSGQQTLNGAMEVTKNRSPDSDNNYESYSSMKQRIPKAPRLEPKRDSQLVKNGSSSMADDSYQSRSKSSQVQ